MFLSDLTLFLFKGMTVAGGWADGWADGFSDSRGDGSSDGFSDSRGDGSSDGLADDRVVSWVDTWGGGSFLGRGSASGVKTFSVYSIVAEPPAVDPC
jgi:hypothetical protein